MQEGIADADRELVLPDSKVIYKDEMVATVDAEVFQKQLWDMFQFQFSNKLSLPQIDRIRWHLFPEVRIQTQNLFNFEEETEDKTPTALPDIVRILDIQQEQLARSLGLGIA